MRSAGLVRVRPALDVQVASVTMEAEEEGCCQPLGLLTLVLRVGGEWPLIGAVAISSASSGRAGPELTFTGSGVALRFDRVEVPYGIAVVLPLLLQDHVQARASGLLVFGIVRVLARLGQHIR